MFQLINPTHVRLKHINLRQETHGKAKVSAVDLDFVCEGTASMLALLHEKLPGALCFDPDDDSGQSAIAEMEPKLRKLRFPRMTQFPWSDDGTGFDLTVHYGLDDEVSRIEFGDGKASTKRVEIDGNAMAKIFWRYSTCVIQDGALDKLREKLEQAVEITLVQNERLRDQAVQDSDGDAIDGTTEAFERDHPSATDLFMAGAGDDEGPSGDPESDEEEDSEGGATDLEERLDNALARADAAPEKPSTTRSPAQSRTARGREKTAKALAQGAPQ